MRYLDLGDFGTDTLGDDTGEGFDLEPLLDEGGAEDEGVE